MAFAHDDFKKCRHGTRVTTQERHLVALLNLKIDIAKQNVAILRGRKPLYLQNLVANLALGGEDDAGIAAR